MSEPWPDALFGVDGTELPVPSDRNRGPDAAVPPPFVLPPIPPLGMTREAIAATLGDDLAGQPVPPAGPTTPQASVAAPLPVAPIPQSETRPGAAAYNQRPVIAPVAPAQPPPRGGGRLRYRQPLMGGSPSLQQLRNTRRLVVRRLPTRTRSNGGAGAFFLAVSIVFAVLLYFIISGIVEAFARLIP